MTATTVDGGRWAADTSQLLADGTNTYSFDLAGNRNSSGYTTGAGNRISSDGTWNYAWDDEGNLSTRTNIASGVVWVLSWDHNNRLTKVERKPSASGAVDLRVEYQFDVFGNRIKRTVDADGDGSGSSTSTKYAFDPIGNTWADLDNAGSLTSRRFFEDALDAVFARMCDAALECVRRSRRFGWPQRAPKVARRVPRDVAHPKRWKATALQSALVPVDLRVEYQFDVFGNRVKRTVDADGDGSGSSTSL